jgi:hypothetical protein
MEAQETICPGYSRRYASKVVPHALFVGTELVSLTVGAEVIARPTIGQTIAEWTLVGSFMSDGAPVCVLEELSVVEGDIVFVGPMGILRRCAKSLEPTSEERAGLAFHGIESWYRGHPKAEVLPDHRDVLRDELLASGDDPTPDAVAACYPPARHAFFEGQLRPHTFVGTGVSDDVVPLYYQDVTMVSRVPIGVIAPGSERASAAGELWEGLVGGWAPLVRTVYPVAADESWEIITFASSATANAIKQPVWYRAVHLKAGAALETKYIDSFLPFPHAGTDLRERFYGELLATLAYWDATTVGAMEVMGWDWLADRSRHAFAREMITRHGSHPKYGIADQAYAGAEHDGFQDVLVSSVLGCLEWGYFERARAYLDEYFTNFVRPDGTLHYRGPEMGKYGVSLTCLGLYFDYTRDASLLVGHRQKIDAIVDMLIGRWTMARKRSPEDPAYGMIPGYHEADINFLTPNVYELDYDRPYLSNTGEAWRGLRDLARAYQAIGESGAGADLAARGEQIGTIASAIFEDARRGVERSWVAKDGVLGLPIIAGDTTFYWEHPYRARPESYDENRVWSELYFGGSATRETVEKIWTIAGERGHTTLGVFNNRKSMVGFLVWEEIAGLVQHDMIPEALLTFYAQAMHAHTRGTWTAIECVDMDRARGAHSPYCLPAQMTLPIVAKWLLVYEDPVSEVVTLARGLPRECLADGRSIGISDAPTRWGKVCYTLTSQLAAGRIEADVTLPERARGGTFQLRLRAPRGHLLRSASADGVSLPLDCDCVLLPKGKTGRLHIVTDWVRSTP